MARGIRTDATDVSVTVRFLDSSDGTPETGVTSATAGLDIYYRKGVTGAKTSLSESNLSALTDAHSDGGMLHIGSGWYRVDVPDAAVPDSAGESTFIGCEANDMIGLGVELVGITDINAAEVNAQADTALTDYDPPTRAELTSDIAGLNDISASDVWTNSSRTLTQGAASVVSAVTGSAITVYRGSEWSITLPISDITGWTKLWFGIKASPSEEADTASVCQVVVTAGGNAGDGLLYFEGETATAANGAITVNSTTSITITVDHLATGSAIPRGGLSYEVAYLDAGGDKQLASAGGTATIKANVIRATS